MTTAIVTGDRHATDAEWARTVSIALQDHGVDHVIHGDARGIDSIADMAAMSIGATVSARPAAWNQHGRSAGPIRNELMLKDLQEDALQGESVLVLAFHRDLSNSKGTGHMVRIARAAGIRVVHYDAPIPEPKEL